MNEELSLDRAVEAILFASQKPVSAKELSAIFKGAAEGAKENPFVTCHAKPKREDFQEAIRKLDEEYRAAGRAFEVRESAAGWQLVTRGDFSPWLRQLFPENRSAKLSAPALETLAIIAYRQPITRADIEAVRGVAVDGVMQTLLDRGLVRIAGRSEVPGRPLLYETTQFFMEHFGLKDLDDLPNADELRKIALPQAAVPAAEPPAAEPPAAETPAAETPELPLEEAAVPQSADPADLADLADEPPENEGGR
ncbi:MAG: SMC-Scp complex subunit ScpB [Verrucomicrobiae bacterium]